MTPLGSGVVKITMRLKLGEVTLNGTTIEVSLAGQKLSIDFLEIKLSDSKSRFISFQDTKNEDGRASMESIETLQIISNSIKYYAQ